MRSRSIASAATALVFSALAPALLTAVIWHDVVGQHVDGNEEVVAFVQLLPGAKTDTAELGAFAAKQLTSYKRPSEIVLLDTLPAASTGKVLKNKLRDLAAYERR